MLVGIPLELVAAEVLAILFVKVGDNILLCWVGYTSHPDNVDFEIKNMVVLYCPSPVNDIPNLFLYDVVFALALKF